MSRCASLSWLVLAFSVGQAAAQDTPPRSLDARLKIELFAEQPQIVTPTGIDVDVRGRVWAIECNTHFPKPDYKGHPHDRVLVMSDTDGDGRADKTIVFRDGLHHAMSVVHRPRWYAPHSLPDSRRAEGQRTELQKNVPSESRNPRSEIPLPVYIATRRDITLHFDDDGDDKADRSEMIVRLDTKGDYPHNGLAGIAFDAVGWMYFGFGENLGADYKIIGSDGVTLSGGGEGGNLYRCRPDGSKLEKWATGFWNPHSSAFDAFGRLFTVDNDPDSRPPCRLLHIVQGGDYGYRFRNGRKGLHPFTSWNGEVPGTLPMVAGTGEAPSGVLAYESDGFPEEYLGNLFVTSWGDHRIDRFRLKPKGASFESLAEPVIVGGENFRPVGIACAPDGSLYCTDWVLKDYNVHGKGRIWRVSPVQRRSRLTPDLALIDATRPAEYLISLLDSPRTDIRRSSATALRQTNEGRRRMSAFLADEKHSPRARVEALFALANVPLSTEWIFAYAPNLWGDLLRFDDVHAAALGLIGNPQYELDRYLAWSGRWGAQVPLEKTIASAPILFAALVPAKNMPNEGPALARAALDRNDPFLLAGVVNSILRTTRAPSLDEAVYIPKDDSPAGRQGRLASLLASRRTAAERRSPAPIDALKKAMEDRDESVRRVAIQWIAESQLKDLRPQVENVLNDASISADLFLATLAALEMLDGIPPARFDQTPPGKYVLPLVKDEKRPAAIRALALRMVDPGDRSLDAGLLEGLASSSDGALRLEAVRTMQQSPAEGVLPPLRSIAGNESLPAELRAEAVVGLGRPQGNRLAPESRDLLLKLLAGANPVLRREALRSLRGFAADDADIQAAIRKAAASEGAGRSPLRDELQFALAAAGTARPSAMDVRAAVSEPTRSGDDVTAGRRAFYHAAGAGCFKCHTINGRGGKIGPDLSTIGRALTREKLIDSILEPGKEIAPQFVTWSFETAAGRVHSGMIVLENEGQTIIGDIEGKTTELKTADIVARVPLKTSVMPEKLADRMTLQEFRDLLAYLESLR